MSFNWKFISIISLMGPVSALLPVDSIAFEESEEIQMAIRI